MFDQEIWEALEATTQGKKQGTMFSAVANVSKREIFNHRDQLMRFLDEIEDSEISVGELRDALERYE